MPSYRHLFEPSETDNSTDPTRGSALVAYLASLGETTGEARRQVVQQAVIDTRGGDRQRGHELFETYCSACHGSRAVGDGELSDLRFGPATVRNMNLRKPHFSWQQPRATEGFPEGGAEGNTDPAPALDEVLGRVVRFGRPDTSMPGHEWLTDREVADLVAFVIDLPGTADGPTPWESGP